VESALIRGYRHINFRVAEPDGPARNDWCTGDYMKDSVVLITGSTGDIGRATAFALARRGARLALVGRDIRKLDALASDLRSRGLASASIAYDPSSRLILLFGISEGDFKAMSSFNPD